MKNLYAFLTKYLHNDSNQLLNGYMKYVQKQPPEVFYKKKLFFKISQYLQDTPQRY